jgi:arabinogalactan endo-1,4-beta-galactosidase
MKSRTNKILLAVATLFASLILLSESAFAQQYADYAFGADLSFLKQVEDSGTKFKDGGVEKPGLQIFRDHGYNWVRLRICVEPVGARLPNDLAYTIAMAREAKKLGYKIFLTFHYSNAWADPGGEPTPEKWRGLSSEALIDAIFTYTRDVIAAMRDADVMPDMVGIGNEITNGFCWPVGKLPENWDTLAGMVYAGINGVDAGRGNSRRPKILLHIDHGGDVYNTKKFFDKINSYGIPFDVVGVSFYPWSHGTLVDLRENLAFIANEYHKEVVVVETGYYWKPSRFFTNSPPPFPETPEGQKQWLEAVNDVVMQTPNGLGKGVFWWEPAANRGLRSRGYFDDDGNALPILEAFHKFTRPPQRVDGNKRPDNPPSAVHFGPAS